MTPGLATLVALLLYALGLAPVIWLWLRPGNARWLAPAVAALVMVLAFYQTGLLRSASLASSNVSHLVRLDTPENRCQEIFDLLVTNGVLLKQPSLDGLVVRGAGWDQLPPPVREAVTGCAQSVVGADDEILVIRQ